jgi:hypothetical protein
MKIRNKNEITMKMDKHIKKALAGMSLLLLSTVPTQIKAQLAYKGQLYINDERFYRDGSLLHVYMRVSYSRNAIGTGEQLTFTPVIKTGDNEYRMSSVVINGDKREIAEHRKDILSRRQRLNTPVVVKDNHKGTRYFVYDTSIPYAQWMENSELYVESEECNCNGHRAHVYEDRLLANIPVNNGPQQIADQSVVNESQTARYDVSKWVQFLTPPTEDGRDFNRTGVIEWNGKQDMSKMGENNQNKYICNMLDSKVKEILEQYGTTLSGVVVTGYGSPIGNFSKNEKESMERALSLKRYLMRNLVTNKNELNVSWVSEDWDSIASLVTKSHMALREAVLDIIKTVKVVDGREHVIENLDGGVPYGYMNEHIFPEVKRITYTLTFNHKNMDVGAAKLMLKRKPENMTLEDFYTVADSYEQGTREFNDIIDLSARLFPDSPEANINASAVAMLRGDTKLARKYITRWQTDPRAYENMGVLNLMEGNRDKAEVYLKMAQAGGVDQATTVINALNIK